MGFSRLCSQSKRGGIQLTVANYDQTPSDGLGEIMTVDNFRDAVAAGAFIDYDGFGYPVKNGKYDDDFVIIPSQVSKIPDDATHIMWFNR